ncbi:hypothetical protein [Agromyces arachidis]|uniref:hypothetical protein n=1 Tax=Agromyces arachidis TaxID=766966 RepID=UPI0040571ACE
MNTAITAAPSLRTGHVGPFHRMTAAIASARARRRAAAPTADELYRLQAEAARLRDEARNAARFSHVF